MARERANIKVEGVAQTMKALRDFEPDLYKEMGKSIRASMRLLRDTASRRRPEGVYKATTSLLNKKGPRGSVTATAGSGAMSVSDYLNAQGSSEKWDAPLRSVIFEFAQNAQRPGMRAAIASFNARYGSPGRFLWAAYDDIGEYVESDIERAIRDAERTLQSNLDSGAY